ncbi:2-amino-3-ketobutyrate coenzyme A ligase, mitochondrial isoform X1 [Wyeomyia smithii]|uniref:2-amino-3-ketobutyrate coenzyme A ligase, mitochondrial isoform X1 n=1 Tax=Wyeomyia smithii TaxID=174621 RepID=UPI0024680573|nr:2-amino-3-ketobutyrate coenzyme A ligase, mitochondrial isoform X1 [Wyeomyia smithii]XP_055533170.1 2-amino-3-ketobutyrate coenzyme A ligase, mitochondrial isoform X1 [Wyeomyia smithii]
MLLSRQLICKNALSKGYPGEFVASYSSLAKPERAAQKSFREVLQTQLNDIEKAGTYKKERIIVSPQATAISVDGSEGKILNFCANNYLGLASNDDVVNFSKKALDEYGAGLSSVRFICGTQNIHKQLEAKLSAFHQREDTILYASCFDANAGIFEAVLSPEDAVFSDELNHASIIDGIRLCKAKKDRYLHRDMKDLEEKLKSSDARIKMIVTDGVFSMDGNVAPLPEIFQLADKYNALTFVDDCHATGFFGPSGRGTEEFYGMWGRCDIINSTLGKALGGAAGGYTTGPKELIDLLRQRSRPYLFSNSLPPPVVASGMRVIEMLMESNQLTARVQSNTRRFRTAMTKAGFTISGMDHPISPVMLGDARLASVFADEMLKRGIYVIGFSYPVVPKGKARIRVQLSAAHTDEEIDRAVSAFIEVGKQLSVIP